MLKNKKNIGTALKAAPILFVTHCGDSPAWLLFYNFHLFARFFCRLDTQNI
jgi:hypothetical protein